MMQFFMKDSVAPVKPGKPRGKQLLPGLSITGIDDRSVNQIKALINKEETKSLAIFLATQRPGIIELEEFLAKTRAKFRQHVPMGSNLSDPDTAQEVLTSFTLDKLPAGLRFNQLGAKEQLELLTFDPTSQHMLSSDLMALFGGQAFDKCFEFYIKHKKSVAIKISENHPDRTIAETLAQTELADKGRQIPLDLRLTVLSMDQLRQMCKDLKTEVKFANKHELTEALSKIPGAAVLLSMHHTVDDLFVLNPLKQKEEDIKKEWDYLCAYARLLTTAS